MVREVEPKTPLGKAIGYARRQWKRLTRFLEDPLMDLTNNEVERDLRRWVLDRKTWQFVGHETSARRLAGILSILTTCRKMGVEPRRYLRETLAKILAFATAGGVAALSLRGLPFSIPAGVGFIALAGVSVMSGVVMTSSLLGESADMPVVDRVRRSAVGALRPITSTALVAAIGFIPMAIATGPGAEVQRPLATVVIGGLISALLFSLPALPAMLLLVARRADAPADVANATRSATTIRQ